MTRSTTNQSVETARVSIARAGEKAIKPEIGLIDLNIHTTVIDRQAGTTVTEEIWRDDPNINVIMRNARQPDARRECAEFFLSRKLNKVISDVVTTRTVKKGDVIIQPEALFNAITKNVASSAAGVVIMEVVNSYLRRLGMMTNNGEFCTETYYPVKRVTVEDLSDDIAMQEVVRVLSGVTGEPLGNAKTFSVEAFASAITEALIPVGRAFLDINQLSSMVDDIVKGIRSNISNGRTEFHTGFVPADWREHAVVQELATNYTFIMAALALPVGSDITPVNDTFRREQWAPTILAALKTSLRYKMVDKQELLRQMTKRTVFDLKDRPVCYVMNQNAAAEPVGQCVYAFNDVSLTSSVTIVPLKERVDQAIAAAYPKDQSLGLDNAAMKFVDFMRDAVEGGYIPNEIGFTFNVGLYDEPLEHEMVCIIANRVQVEDAKKGVNLPMSGKSYNPDPKGWWYEVECEHKMFAPLLAGSAVGDRFITNNAGEALLAMKDFEATAIAEKRPQMISPKAFNSRLMHFNEGVLVDTTERFAYDVTIGKLKIHGSFKTHDLASLRSAAGTSVVKPRYNDEVITAISEVFKQMENQVAKFKAQQDPEIPDTLVAFLERRIPAALLDFSRTIGEGFRNEVHYGIIRRSTKDLTADEAMGLSARLSQRQFGAYADAAAFALFLAIQGMDIRFIQSILGSSVYTKSMMELGTDRPALL